MTTLLTQLTSKALPSLTTLTLALAAGHAFASAGTGSATTGKTKAAMCMGCHNIPGYQAAFPQVYKVPKIAGQNAKYIVSALQAYQKGDRKYATMQAIAASLTEQDMADLAAYYEQQGQTTVKVVNKPAKPAKLASPQVAALLTKGNCVTCHGADFNSPIDATYPKLAGQHPDFLLASLKSYQHMSAKVGRSNAIMAGQVTPFNATELALLANHLGSLPGDVKTVVLPKFK
jgi:cytochrome c553